MSIEINCLQASLPGISLEKENKNILYNDWQKFANEHGVNIPVPKKSRQYNIIHRQRKIYPDESCLYESTFDISINRFKKNHGNSRPIWAKLYREKAVLAKEYIISHIPYEKSENGRFNYVEKEEFKFEVTNITVLRYADYAGSCQRVITIWNGITENPRVRQEDKISKNIWQVSSDKQLPIDKVQELLMPLVAQSH